MTSDIRKEVQNRLREIGGVVSLGESASYNWVEDPARLLYSLSRYKFVQRMFTGHKSVLEVGCADGLGAYLVSKAVGTLTCIDIDSSLIESAKESVLPYAENIRFIAGDITNANFLSGHSFDSAYMLDVLEHIPSTLENAFISSLALRLKPFGSVIIGMPSLESQVYASKLSKAGHVNCKTYDQLKELCNQYFMTTYIFGANDEIVHTGFPQLSHYRIALCSAPRCHHEP